jgi:WD40 repeat protein
MSEQQQNSPPESPFHRRIGSIRDENVFNRLTSETKQSPMPEQGNIKPYSGNTNRFRFSPITLTHVAEGHSKAILSVDSNDYKLYTGSKDRTAKVWDLITGQEIASLGGHINNVSKIKYCPESQLCFTISSYYVKVWDLREKNNSKCVKTLCSSGLANDGDLISLSQVKMNSRISQNEIPFGEKIINDLVVNEYGTCLYTASGSSVKLWDLRQ